MSGTRRRLVLTLVAAAGALVAAGGVGGAQDAPRQPSAGVPRADSAKSGGGRKKDGAKGAKKGTAGRDSTPRPPTPLFERDEPLRLALTADFRDVFKSRDTLRPRPRPARLTYWPADGGAPVTIPVTLSTRGHFRLRSSTCSFAPLRVSFDSGGTKGTPFARQRALKLTTHCQSGSREFEQNVLREYLAYRVFNRITDRSFRVRLARVSYVEQRDTSKVVTAPAFFVESDRDLARRLGARVIEARGGRFEDFEPAQTDLLSVFQYMIGNTDFSIWALHNIRVLATPAGYLPVPYDFDWSGVVGARYAVPDPRLGISTVRERLYRGPCRSASQLAPAFARFLAQRDSIAALYRALPDLDPRYVQETDRYYAEFYDAISQPGRWKEVAGGACRVAQ